eukprot:s4150_g5.t1
MYRGAGNWEGALQLIRGSASPDLVGYNNVLSALRHWRLSASGRAQCWRRAVEMLSEIQRQSLESDPLAEGAALLACAEGDEWEQVLWLLTDSKERRIRQHLRSYNTAISACGKASEWEQALQLFGDMEDHRLRADIVTYSAAMMACEPGP